MISMLKLTFLYHFYHIQLYRCYLWIFLRLFLHPLDSLSKLLTPPCTHTEFTLFLFYPNTHQPYLGNSQLVCALGTKFPTTSIRNYSVISALIIFKSFCLLGRWQLVWWSVIKPTLSLCPIWWGNEGEKKVRQRCNWLQRVVERKESRGQVLKANCFKSFTFKFVLAFPFYTRTKGSDPHLWTWSIWQCSKPLSTCL